MVRHAFVQRARRRRIAVATAASAALAGGLVPLLPTPASALPVAQETVVPAQLRNTYTSAAFLNSSSANGHDSAGAQGVFHRVEGSEPSLWTRYADGESVPVPVRSGASAIPTGSDVLAYKYPDGQVELWNAADGTTQRLQMPAGTGFLNPYDNLVVGFRNGTAEDGTSTRIIHLLTPGADGSTRDVTVGGGPAGLKFGLPAGADAKSVFLRATLDGEARLVAVDRESGQVQSWSGPLSIAYSKVWISPDHVVVGAYDKAKVLVFPRADLSAAPAEVVLRNVGDQVNSNHDLAVVGDWLVNGVNQVVAQPIGGGAAVTLMPSSAYGMVSGPGGTAVKMGRAGADDWGIQRIAPGPDGAPVVTQVKPLPKPAVPVQGISLDQGRLVVTDTSRNGTRDDYVRSVAVTGSPEYGERVDFTPRLTSDVVIGSCATDSAACAPLHGTADGRIVWLEHGSDTSELLRVNGPTTAGLWQRSVPAGGRVTEVSGRYVLYTAADKQYVYAIGNDGTPALTRTPGAAALSGDVLWTAGATPGTVTAYDLTAKKTTETLTTDAGCMPTELQALGRWIYWTCGGRAGVFDRTAKKSVAVPAGEAKLGDGYVVTHDKRAGKLTLTAVAGGSAESRIIGDLPDTGVSQRDVRWTVDESGANAAYVDDQERVHLVPSGVAQQPLRLLAPARSASSVGAHEIDTIPDTLTTVLLSKPAATWDLTVRNRATGKVYGDGRDGGAARGELSVGWHGDDPGLTGDVFLPDGSYDWTLSVTPADGVGGPLQVRGTVRLHGGSPVRHDHVGAERLPDGTADLLTLNSTGGLTFQQGDGKGAFAGKATGSGWSTKTVAVPFGDLNGDRCNDVLVRMSDGSLRGYKPACGTAPTPSTPYKALGTGWNAYDVLTSPGDLTGDRRPDLLARKASTGDIYLFAAKSDGTLAAGKRIRTAWKGYTKIVGAGDLNGDGIGDVLARDKAGTLYRYNGTGTGPLKDRVKVFSGWGASYNAIVGVGDITGDGKSDLVERDTSGNVYRNAGTGTGSFGSRVKIASGWQGYRGLF
ncbi:VCBS repeat-containing protein [Streptomyces sp. NBC_01571]|uniref:FG-GAP repeat domain-containing protein n=1 Tax=Streptomyces sp. NBC_01571 TaxID=2975883 RepID=UPI002253B655|nr:VCBS repeat-containing protein [Streptomyces sp. NBC_01571]MCX4576023.1 VCBS repeat-containing protein [Streptomyces sp. NBC_01571]